MTPAARQSTPRAAPPRTVCKAHKNSRVCPLRHTAGESPTVVAPLGRIAHSHRLGTVHPIPLARRGLLAPRLQKVGSGEEPLSVTNDLPMPTQLTDRAEHIDRDMLHRPPSPGRWWARCVFSNSKRPSPILTIYCSHTPAVDAPHTGTRRALTQHLKPGCSVPPPSRGRAPQPRGDNIYKGYPDRLSR